MNPPAAPPTPCQTSVRSACRDTKLIAPAVSPGPLAPARRSRVHTGPMTAAEKAGKNAGKQAAEMQAAGQENPLPPEMTAALAAFERHLRAERSLSPHTVRAYLADPSPPLPHAPPRAAAVLELPDAAGARGSEVWGLAPASFDQARRTVRARGKGDKDRPVPVGVPPLRAGPAWLDQGRPVLATATSGPALFLGARGGRLDPRTARRIVHQRPREGGATRDTGPHGLRHSAATHLLDGAADLRSGQA